MKKICVLGAGSWGTALAILLCNNGHGVTVWSIDPEEVLMLMDYREQRDKLPGVMCQVRLSLQPIWNWQ